jgi:hypothetical protein
MGFDTESQEKINLYPNPATDAFYINGLVGPATVKFIDLNGRILQVKQVIDKESISVSSLLKGMYILKIITSEGTIEKKLIKK